MNSPTIPFFALSLSALIGMLIFAPMSYAHHSFAAYDVNGGKIEITGLLTKYRFAQPHILMELEISEDDGTKTSWKIESLVPRRWDRLKLDRNFAELGDTVTIIGWPAKDGSADMMLSAIRKGDELLIARDEIRQ